MFVRYDEKIYPALENPFGDGYIVKMEDGYYVPVNDEGKLLSDDDVVIITKAEYVNLLDGHP